MSDKTLFNQTLVLSNLIVSNNEYSNVSGFVPTVGTISSSKDAVSLNVNNFEAESATIGSNDLNNSGIQTPVVELKGTSSAEQSFNLYSNNNSLLVIANNLPTANLSGVIFESPLGGQANIYCDQNGIIGTQNLEVSQNMTANVVEIQGGSTSVQLTCNTANTLSAPYINVANVLNSPQIGVVNGANAASLQCLQPNTLTVSSYVKAAGFIGGLINTSYIPPSSILISGTQTETITFPFPSYENPTSFIFNFVPFSDNVAGCVCISYQYVSQNLTANTATYTVQLQCISGNSSVSQINVFGANSTSPL
jgi:hypothetical protein